MAYTNEGLVKYCKDILTSTKTAYMWGGLMKPITLDYINYKAAQYPNQYSKTRIAYLKRLIGTGYGCDCVGLIKSYYFGGIGSPKYDASKDTNTNGFYNIATEKGDINTIPEIPGLILYMDGHVGVYIGNGECIECTLGEYGDGVVKTKVSGRGWKNWLKIPYIKYLKPAPPQTGNCDKNCPYCKAGYYPYTVKSGDSFWKIAANTLGDGNRYMEICKLNNMPANSVIHPGDIIKIPLE